MNIRLTSIEGKQLKVTNFGKVLIFMANDRVNSLGRYNNEEFGSDLS